MARFIVENVTDEDVSIGSGGTVVIVIVTDTETDESEKGVSFNGDREAAVASALQKLGFDIDDIDPDDIEW